MLKRSLLEMNDLIVIWLPLLLGLLSSAFWLGASFIKIPFGWDVDPNPANKKISKLNAIAALCAALAIGVQIYNQLGA